MKQRTEEWYKARKGLVTASNAGAILGLDPYRDHMDVLRAMVRDYHGAEPEFTGNVATEYGTFHEAGVRQEYEMENNKKILECGFYVHENGWLGASPDGLVDDGLLEIKCPFRMRKDTTTEHKSIDDQPHYYAQMQVQMYVTGREWCDFFQWAPHATKLERVDADPEWLEKNLPLLEDFYRLYQSELDNPAHLEDKCKEIDNEKAAKLIAEYDEVCDQLDFASTRKEEIMEELVGMAGERDALVCGRKLTKVERAGSVAYAKVVKDHCPDVDVEPYRGKPSVSWRLT